MYQSDPKRVLTPECRLSYCNLVTARAPQNGVGDPKFSVTLLIPKSNPTIKQELDAVCAPPVSLLVRSAVAAGWLRRLPRTSPMSAVRTM